MHDQKVKIVLITLKVLKVAITLCILLNNKIFFLMNLNDFKK